MLLLGSEHVGPGAAAECSPIDRFDHIALADAAARRRARRFHRHHNKTILGAKSRRTFGSQGHHLNSELLPTEEWRRRGLRKSKSPLKARRKRTAELHQNFQRRGRVRPLQGEYHLLSAARSVEQTGKNIGILYLLLVYPHNHVSR